MGKTPKALQLTILVPCEWLDRPEVLELAEKGHTIQAAPEADLILSPQAHAWHEPMWGRKSYLDAALKRARGAKREATR